MASAVWPCWRVRGLSRLPRAPARVGAAVKELRATGGTQAARCSLNRPTGPDRRLAVATVELAAVVDVAHDYGGSVNDVVLSAIDGALLTLLAGRGEQVQRLVVSIPVSRRQATTAAELGNQVGVAPMELPALTNRVERLRVIVARGALIRSAPRGHRRICCCRSSTGSRGSGHSDGLSTGNGW